VKHSCRETGLPDTVPCQRLAGERFLRDFSLLVHRSAVSDRARIGLFEDSQIIDVLSPRP
jgi:hypothetical protein